MGRQSCGSEEEKDVHDEIQNQDWNGVLWESKEETTDCCGMYEWEGIQFRDFWHIHIYFLQLPIECGIPS